MHISLKPNNDKKASVKYFCCEFMGRYPQLTLRNEQSTPLTRCTSANLRFYDSFQNLEVGWQKLLLHLIHSMQMERDTIAYVHINSNVPSLRGQKQVGKLSSEVSGCNMTNVLYERHWANYSAPLHFPREQKLTRDLRKMHLLML
jgi:hypothetical protein